MLALRRFNNKLVQGTVPSLKTGSPAAYENKEQKPPLVRIPRETGGHIFLAPGAIKILPLPMGYDKTTERLYCLFRVQGLAKFGIITDGPASNTLVKGTSTQQGRYAFSDFITSIGVSNPSSTDNVQIQYVLFVLPDLDDDANFFGLVSPVVTPGDSGGTGTMASNCCSRIYANSTRLDYSGTAVTTGAWQLLLSATSAPITLINIFDSSGQTMEIGTGSPGSETRICLVAPGGPGDVAISIPLGVPISVRAVSGTADVGEIDINLFS